MESKKLACVGAMQITLVEGEKRIVLPWHHNKWVDVGMQAIAAGMGMVSGYKKGLWFWAIGAGNPGWGVSPPEPPDNQTELVDEKFRKQIEWNFWTERADLPIGTISAVPTNNIRALIVVTPAEWDEVTDVRECGLFGGNAMDIVDSGLLFAVRNYPAIMHTAVSTVQVDWRLTFIF